MNQILSYIPKASPIHALDARVKLGLLLLFSIALFCMRTWIGAGDLYGDPAGCHDRFARSAQEYGRVLLPALAILIFIWVCNSIPFDAARSLNALMYVVRISLVIMASFVITFTTTSTQLTDALGIYLGTLCARSRCQSMTLRSRSVWHCGSFRFCSSSLGRSRSRRLHAGLILDRAPYGGV